MEKRLTGKRIPISDAKRIAKERGYSQVIIHGYDGNTGIQSGCPKSRYQISEAEGTGPAGIF